MKLEKAVLSLEMKCEDLEGLAQFNSLLQQLPITISAGSEVGEQYVLISGDRTFDDGDTPHISAEIAPQTKHLTYTGLENLDPKKYSVRYGPNGVEIHYIDGNITLTLCATPPN